MKPTQLLHVNIRMVLVSYQRGLRYNQIRLEQVVRGLRTRSGIRTLSIARLLLPTCYSPKRVQKTMF